MYSSKDAITACWLHENGVTGSGSWNFGCSSNEDCVEIFGSKGKIEFSIFAGTPVIISSDLLQQNLIIEHPKNIQYLHVKNMRDFFFENTPHPSTGKSALHTSWIMDKILGN